MKLTYADKIMKLNKMEEWFSTANMLISNVDHSINPDNYNTLSLVKSQAHQLMNVLCKEEQEKCKEVISNVDNVLKLSNEVIKNEIDTNDKEQCDKEALILLGCKDKHEQSKRVKILHEYLLKMPNSISCILFSGGGYDINECESSLMMNEFLAMKSPDLKCILICEDDSMDTVGNALFSRYIINNYEFSNVKVFTSTFHVTRTYNIFSRVFDPSSLSVIGTNDYNFNSQTIESELKSNFLSDKSIFTMKCGEIDIHLDFQDWRTSMLQLFINHDLYKKRFDLMRKYLVQFESESF